VKCIVQRYHFKVTDKNIMTFVMCMTLSCTYNNFISKSSMRHSNVVLVDAVLRYNLVCSCKPHTTN